MNSENFTYSGAQELFAMELMDNYNQHIVALLKQSHANFESVVDFGAGIGTLTKLVKKYAKNLICIELDSKQREVLNKLGFTAFENIEAIQDGSQTLIYSSNVLEHIEDDYAVVKALYDKLQTKGKVFFYVPAFPCLYTNMDKNVGHFRRYSKKHLRDVVEQAGFKLEKIYYADSLGFFITLLFKYIGNDKGKVSPKQLKIYDRFIFPLSAILDHILRYFLGKNLVVIASK